MNKKLLFAFIFGIFLFSFVSAALIDNQTSYYKLDGTSGSVIDAHGSNNGTNNGATRGVTGKINNSFDFDGTNDYVDLNTEMITEGEEYTVNAWMKSGQSSQSKHAVSQSADSLGRPRLTLRQSGDKWSC